MAMSMTFKPKPFLSLKRFETRLFVVPLPFLCGVRSVSAQKSLTPTASCLGLSETFHRLRQQKKAAFISFITAGDPDLSTTAEALKLLDSCGSDIIELGVPYSAPLADGPVIKASSARALSRGTNYNSIISMLRNVIPQLSCPVALFSYYNPVLKVGIEEFISTIKDVGVRGLLVPDVPWEETEALRNEAVKYGIELVLLTTPTTPRERMKAIVTASEGFIYLVSCTGVTGARASVSGRVQELVTQIKEVTDKPVAVGFGISKPEHVRHVVQCGADGVIVGSALVKLLGEARTPEEGLKKLGAFAKSMKSALI